MNADEFAAIPETLTVREVCLRLSRKGFREKFVIVVTTLLDAERYTAEQLTQLYGWRWRAAEVDLRHLKTSLANGNAHRKKPVMVRKELGRIYWPTICCAVSWKKRPRRLIISD